MLILINRKNVASATSFHTLLLKTPNIIQSTTKPLLRSPKLPAIIGIPLL